MKRKLIDYGAFEKIKSDSLSSIREELDAASELLAEVLDVGSLKIESYGLDGVLFETEDGEFVRADYKMDGGHVQFDNIEQVVLNEETENNKARELISKMIDSLVESDENAAGEMLGEWFAMPRSKRMLSEGKKQPSWLVQKRAKAKRMNNLKRSSSEKNSNKSKRGRLKVSSNERRSPIRKTKNGVVSIVGWKKTKKKKMQEWHVIAENVLGFVDYTQNGPDLDSCRVLRKEGDVVGAKVPTMRLRNEAKILRFDWKTMNTDVVIKRSGAKNLAENSQFVKEIYELKKLNALSDRGFEEAVEKISTNFPSVIYLTESELAKVVRNALDSAGAVNFDDDTCAFLSEALLRTVHDNFVDKVAKIIRISGSEINENAADKYAAFKTVAEELYAKLDEQAALELQAFVDVYEALRQIHEAAKEESNGDVASLAGSHLDGLLPIVMGKVEPDFDVLGEAAEWLNEVVATVLADWEADEPAVKADGEHPELTKKGRHSQSPADMQGSTPAQHHTSDGKEVQGSAAKELANDGWSNIGGEGIYPSLDNPYVPKSEVPKIVGEKDVDSDSDQLAHWGDNETWPNLQNPYSKASVTPKEAK